MLSKYVLANMMRVPIHGSPGQYSLSFSVKLKLSLLLLRILTAMDSIAQIKALYSSLIEGILPKAEQILEKIGVYYCYLSLSSCFLS